MPLPDKLLPEHTDAIRAFMMNGLNMRHPDELKSLKEISAKFRSRGFSVFLVGGAVRNLALSQELKDFDLASDALPEDVISMFKHVIPTGIQHGTVTLVYRGRHYEITTFRLDGNYSDARRPDSISFTPNIEEDLKRRDFTINAMALNLETDELLDREGGLHDLHRGCIRTVGKALERFAEDGLRIVRGIRFAAQLNFTIDLDTLSAMPLCLDKLAMVSIERFRDELMKILGAKLPSTGLYLLRQVGILPLFLQGLAQLSDQEFAVAALSVDLLNGTGPELHLCALLSGLGSSAAAQICSNLRLPNTVTKYTSHLIETTRFVPKGTETEYQLRYIASKIGKERCTEGLDLLTSINTAKQWLLGNDANLPPPDAWTRNIAEIRTSSPENLKVFGTKFLATLEAKPPLSIRDLAINGNQLMVAGIQSGPNMGVLLEKLLDMVLRDPAQNVHEVLLAEARRIQSSASG